MTKGIIETSRLRIVPLSVEQFSLLLKGVEKMEEELKLNPSGHILDEHMQQAMESLYEKAIEHQYEYLWYTNWQIILPADNKAIGSASFKGRPNNKGEVEIGYGINEEYRNKGYMTEAVKALCNWALNKTGIKCIIAETEKDNIASQRVLEKSGMIKYLEVNDSLWWRVCK